SVALLYKRFRPTREAVIAFNSLDNMTKNLRILNQLDLSGIRVKAIPIVADEDWDLFLTKRSRGHKGRKEAAERGSWNGDGPNAGIRGLNPERTVTMWGFPGKATAEAVEKFLDGYDISRSGDGEAMIYKPTGAYSLYSRFLVVLNSEAEAQRVAENLHMTRLPKKNHVVYAQAIY
ncbi:hypothetical protein FA15DRAFT_586478, partial [Coprinopsis marcescibilis]